MAPTAGLRSCQAGQVVARVYGSGGISGGADSLTVFLRNVAGPDCALRTTLHVAIVNRDGSLARPLRGNPAALRIRKVVLPSRGVAHTTWIWMNWCHERKAEPRLALEARASGIGRDRATLPVPFCDAGRALGSSLVPLKQSGEPRVLVEGGAFPTAYPKPGPGQRR